MFPKRVSVSTAPDGKIVSYFHGKNLAGRKKDECIAIFKTDDEGNLKIFNQSGDDVTPLALNQKHKISKEVNSTNTKLKKEERKSSVISLAESFKSGSSHPMNTNAQFNLSTGPFSRSVFGVSLSSKMIDPTLGTCENFTDLHLHEKSFQKKVEVLRNEASFNQPVQLLLDESETETFLSLPSEIVAGDSPEADAVKKKNERYKELQQSKEANDGYLDKLMNTFNDKLKSKSTQTFTAESAEVGVNASRWDLFDSYCTPVEETNQEEESEQVVNISGNENEKIINSENKALLETVKSSEKLDFNEISQSDSFKFSLVVMERVVQLNIKQTKQAFYRGLPAIELVSSPRETPQPSPPPTATTANLNRFPANEANQHSTRGLPVTAALISELRLSLEYLWPYTCHNVRTRKVKCMSWNQTNHDLLAVGYGRVEKVKMIGNDMKAKQVSKPQAGNVDGKKGGVGKTEANLIDVDAVNGVVCCWSIKNIEHPERIYKTSHPVVSLDFSKSSPNLLAVGLESGEILLYDVSSNSNMPILNNFSSSEKHCGPVWLLKWKDGDILDGGKECLVSTSTDGKVLRWTINEDFKSFELMKMRRVPTNNINNITRVIGNTATTTTNNNNNNINNNNNNMQKNNFFVSKYIGGMCFHFSQYNNNVYLVGTEDGDIHKCDCSYIEQYIETYKGHSGPVYEVSWSPFNSNVFLSCGSDWTIRLWTQDVTSSIGTLSSSSKSIKSISWSPRCSTVFACINKDTVEIWDISQSMLEPALKYSPPSSGSELTKVMFALNADCLLIGDTSGQVSVFKIVGNFSEHIDQEEALNKVVEACQIVQRFS